MMRQLLTKLTENYENPSLVATFAKRVPIPAQTNSAEGNVATKLEMHTTPITGDEVRNFFANNVQFLTDWHLKSQTIPPTVSNVAQIINLNYATANVHAQFYNKDASSNARSLNTHSSEAPMAPIAPPPHSNVSAADPSDTAHIGGSLFAAPFPAQTSASSGAPSASQISQDLTAGACVRLNLPPDVNPSVYGEMVNDLNTLSYLFANRSKTASNTLLTVTVGISREFPSALGSAFAHFLLETGQPASNFLCSP